MNAPLNSEQLERLRHLLVDRQRELQASLEQVAGEMLGDASFHGEALARELGF